LHAKAYAIERARMAGEQAKAIVVETFAINRAITSTIPFN